MKEELIKRIKLIPPLPRTFLEIAKICNKSDGTISELSKVVEQDPMFVANLLKMINSNLYGFRREITNVTQAVSLLGMKEIYALCAVVSVKKLLKVDMEPYGIDPEKFALLSNVQGALMRDWLKLFKPKATETLFMPALLQEIGKVIIADEVIRNDESFQFRSDIETAIDVEQVEKDYVGSTSSEVTAKIFEHWKFDDFIVNIIKYSDSYHEAPQEYKEFAIYLRVAKTAVSINSPLSERSIARACHILESESMDEFDFLNAVEKCKMDYEGQI